MSEPNSVYMRLTLTEDSSSAFMSSPLVAPREYSDWLAWLKTRQYYGTISAKEIDALKAPTAADLSQLTAMLSSAGVAPTPAKPLTDPITVGDYVDATVRSPACAPSRSHYDPVSNRWTLIVGQYSENYYDYLEILSILRAASRYKDLPGDDFILIFPYLWGGGEPDAYVEIDRGGSRLIAKAPGRAVEEANLALGTLLAESHFGEDFDKL